MRCWVLHLHSNSYHEDLNKQFRTVYYLHGGRPGNEARSVIISNIIHDLLSNNKMSLLSIFLLMAVN